MLVVFYQTTGRHIPEDSNRHIHQRKNTNLTSLQVDLEQEYKIGVCTAWGSGITHCSSIASEIDDTFGKEFSP
jgi:hypothetical protein